MNILILYSVVMPYNMPVFRELILKGYSIKIIQINKKKVSPYTFPNTKGIELVNLSEFQNFNDFAGYCYASKPVLIMVSEVMEKWYWRIAYSFHKKNKTLPIVLGSDAQWKGSRNNWLKKIFFAVTYKRCFTHVLSAGLWQCMYAIKIGFKREQIIVPLLCADNELYHQVNIQHKNEYYPKKFIFIGRLVGVKGIKILLEAWRTLSDKKGWTLTIIGNGELEYLVKQYSEVEWKPFMPQMELCKIMENSGCALFPSLYEPWGLVIHEATAAGLPVIVSKRCGAVSQFVINKYNGYLVNEGNKDSLQNAMMEIINSSDSELMNMAQNSRRLSYRIMPADVASALLSVL